MKRKFAILLSAMLLMQAVCGCGGAASSGTSSASASTDSTASKSSEKAVIVTDEQAFTHENGITRLAKEIYGDLNVEFFVLSEDTQERETADLLPARGDHGRWRAGRLSAFFPDLKHDFQW